MTKAQIGKWGRSLAVRLPKHLVEKYNLHEGDEIDISALENALKAIGQHEREEALHAMREGRTPLPDDYKFDREEANAR